MIPLETIFRNPSSILTPLHQAWPSVMDAKKPARWRWLLACAERPRVLAPLVISQGGRLTSQKPARCRGRTFFAPLPSGSSKLGRPSWTQKSQRVDAGFWLVRRDRDSNSGTKRIGHSLAGCCITTLPPLQ